MAARDVIRIPKALRLQTLRRGVKNLGMGRIAALGSDVSFKPGKEIILLLNYCHSLEWIYRGYSWSERVIFQVRNRLHKTSQQLRRIVSPLKLILQHIEEEFVPVTAIELKIQQLD